MSHHPPHQAEIQYAGGYNKRYPYTGYHCSYLILDNRTRSVSTDDCGDVTPVTNLKSSSPGYHSSQQSLRYPRLCNQPACCNPRSFRRTRSFLGASLPIRTGRSVVAGAGVTLLDVGCRTKREYICTVNLRMEECNGGWIRDLQRQEGRVLVAAESVKGETWGLRRFRGQSVS